MMRFIVPAVMAAGILLIGAPTAPAQAAPVTFGPVAAPELQVESVRHTRRHRIQQRRAARRMHYRRGYGAAGSPHARNPSRPAHQQNLGNVSGGPRYR
ncbi:hypothetical protein [Enterovirga rhinocerotis]|uniref:Uncharacterized protein n=1 Tax=Enterovirga rhinocerotis TaxID=1339210 RepID=A0A4R7C551_9HYPH|nr:hypothetical protein [Enterovirga rhinocerotis]TDR93680.1 hypothetical protein EV668_0945 [Enterovirga rhinocerotis]